MIKFRKYQNNVKTSEFYKKWYGRAVHDLVEFDEFIEHMANHHCAFSEATIRGVIIEMENCLKELLLDGKAVRLDELGIFRIGLSTKCANTSKEFTTDNIWGVRLNLFLGKRFRADDLYGKAKFREADKYAGFDDDTDGENAASHSMEDSGDDEEMMVTE